uniref:Protein GrpE n=1 Tax=uncultured Flavobacteriia bacterium TaxID=212695 RepID=H6RG37_9BACT|nr:heat shock protein GrpE [uncultured bacterium]CCF99998.1 chaperone protein [uncultured Flavobacteriia bacterium]
MAAKKEKKIVEEEVIQDEKTTQDQVEKDPLAIAQQTIEEEKNKFLRLFAEFENYKKRTAKERIDLFKTASQEVMVVLLPVLDDFERALAELDNKDESIAGIQLIYNKLFDSLKQQGLTKMEVAAKEVFDAEIHEAITQLPATDEHPKGAIIDVVGAGYKLGDLIIRYPKVVVAQ